MAAHKSHFGGELIAGMLIVALVIVFVWFVEKAGGLPYWLSQTSSNIAGSVNTEGLPSFVSNPINNGLESFVEFFSQWYTGNDPSGGSLDGGVAPYFGDEA